MLKVAKFGGTSMANAQSIRAVADIILADKSRRFVVVSAPGKREKTDTKVTDMLYALYATHAKGEDFSAQLEAIKKRFDDIILSLKLNLDLNKEFSDIGFNLKNGANVDYIASRGEYLCAKVFAAFVDFDFIDAVTLIKFDKDGNFDSELTNICCARLKSNKRGVVIPGFYGTTPSGTVKTFTRGGSDFTGSIIARAVTATLYENFTDVDGFMVCDPRIVDNPKLIEILTYKELRELSYMGANVLHPDSIFPVRKNDIPINIKNTFNPSAKGTFIVPTKHFFTGKYSRDPNLVITGLAGRKDFCSLNIEKSMMNNEVGFARKILSVLEGNGISFEHMPSGVDTLSVVFDRTNVSDEDVNNAIAQIKQYANPDFIDLTDKLALIAIVGHGMNRKKGTAARVCASLTNSDINIRMLAQGSSELNIILAVENADYEKAIAALYKEFIC